ncbi:MAG: tetratricopeptide repeat protein [Chloroflexota bacterium]
MKQHRNLFTILLLVVLVVTGCSGSAAGMVNEGNEAFAKQAYEEAWAQYQAAQIEEPELAEPYYNAANALYREGKYDEALEQMQKALAYADQEVLAANGFYNQGNTAYNLQDMAAAVEAYKQALLRDPNDQDAKYNLELALQQLEQQESEQQQNDQEDQGDESDQQNQDEQQQEDQQSQSQDGQGEQQQEDQGEGDQQDENQGDQEQGDQQEGDQSQEGDQGQEGEQSPDGQDQQPGEDGEPETPQGGQGTEPTDEQPDETGDYSVMPEPGQRLSADQARQLLAAIGRGTETLQERLGAIFSGGGRPPLQDW